MKNSKLDVQKIKQTLSLGLPGMEEQYKLAPLNRERLSHINHEDPSIRKAAVLVNLFFNDEQDKLLLTERSTYDGIHSGQISFPGGKFEEKETDPIQVALREAEEEIGIPSNEVDIIGLMSPLYIPVSKMYVQPVLSCSNFLNWNPSNKEVAQVLEVPISDLLSIDAVKYKDMELSDRGIIQVPYFDFRGHHIWGATAMMINELLAIIRRTF
ncbi:MAG TPA: CoA pyrophosphatase [Flavobacteriales bacterium]|nr:CoA pyrophosphatase [Flavobacteriales bacterium]